MSDEPVGKPAGSMLEADAFAALRDLTAAGLGADARLIEKDYWATRVLHAATRPVDGAQTVYKGGTSLSKAYGIIDRFSEDIDLLVVADESGKPLKRRLRKMAEAVTAEVGLDHVRESEGRGWLNVRFSYSSEADYLPILTQGVLLEMGSRGGSAPNERREVRPLMTAAAEAQQPGSSLDYSDLEAFEVTVLSPQRTLAEKLAFLHHRATTGDVGMLRSGARHLYDVAMILRHGPTLAGLDETSMGQLMVDVDSRSEAAGWPYTPRPDRGFAQSVAFAGTGEVGDALRGGYQDVQGLAWSEIPSFEEALATVHAEADRI